MASLGKAVNCDSECLSQTLLRRLDGFAPREVERWVSDHYSEAKDRIRDSAQRRYESVSESLSRNCAGTRQRVVECQEAVSTRRQARMTESGEVTGNVGGTDSSDSLQKALYLQWEVVPEMRASRPKIVLPAQSGDCTSSSSMRGGSISSSRHVSSSSSSSRRAKSPARVVQCQESDARDDALYLGAPRPSTLGSLIEGLRARIRLREVESKTQVAGGIKSSSRNHGTNHNTNTDGARLINVSAREFHRGDTELRAENENYISNVIFNTLHKPKELGDVTPREEESPDKPKSVYKRMTGCKRLSYEDFTAIIRGMERRGLDSTDIAKIGGMLLGVKYTLWLVFIAGGVRFRPIVGLVQRQLKNEEMRELLRKRANTVSKKLGMKHSPEKFFEKKRDAYRSSETVAKARYRIRNIRTEVKANLHERMDKQREFQRSVMEKAEHLPGAGASGAAKTASGAAKTASGAAKTASGAAKTASNGRTSSTHKKMNGNESGATATSNGNASANSSTAAEAGASATNTTGSASAEAAASESHEASKVREIYESEFAKSSRFNYWLVKYYDIALGLATKSEKWRWLQYLARICKNKPSNLALGVAEGTLMYKFTLPITMPITALFLTQMMIARKAMEQKQMEEEGHHSGSGAGGNTGKPAPKPDGPSSTSSSAVGNTAGAPGNYSAEEDKEDSKGDDRTKERVREIREIQERKKVQEAQQNAEKLRKACYSRLV